MISFIKPLGPIHSGTARCVRSSLEMDDKLLILLFALLRTLSSLSCSSTSSSAAATAAACAAASRAHDAALCAAGAACAVCAASMGAVMGVTLRAGCALLGRLGDAGGRAADGTSSSETSVSERL